MEVTFDDLMASLDSLYTKEITIPDLTNSPFVISPIDLKNQQYYFEFFWNERQQKCFLSIFRLSDSQRIYYVKNICLRNGLEISKHINKTDWEGLLYFESIMLIFDDDYIINDIGEKFVLRYYASP